MHPIILKGTTIFSSYKDYLNEEKKNEYIL